MKTVWLGGEMSKSGKGVFPLVFATSEAARKDAAKSGFVQNIGLSDVYSHISDPTRFYRISEMTVRE